MKVLHPMIAAMAGMAIVAGVGIGQNTYAIEALPEMSKRPPRHPQTRTRATEPPIWENEHVNTRQVRRQRERLAAKSRSDYPPRISSAVARSKYMPHIGAKERGRYAR